MLDEPEAEAYRVALEDDETRPVSAATLLATAIVIEARTGEAGGRELDLLIHKADIAVVAAYALARASGEGLLFKGEDFSKADIRPAI